MSYGPRGSTGTMARRQRAARTPRCPLDIGSLRAPGATSCTTGGSQAVLSAAPYGYRYVKKAEVVRCVRPLRRSGRGCGASSW
jgi:hypothetical protein